jgi:hypothetical protein
MLTTYINRQHNSNQTASMKKRNPNHKGKRKNNQKIKLSNLDDSGSDRIFKEQQLTWY